MAVPGVVAADYEDFEAELHLLVEEEATLFELTLTTGATRRPPWPSEACSWLLLAWLDAGLIGVYRLRADDKHEALARDDARTALTSIGEWPTATALCLFETAAGAAAPHDLFLQPLNEARGT